MIKIRIIFPKPNRAKPFIITGDYLGKIENLMELLEAEQAINRLTNLQVKIELYEPNLTNQTESTKIK